MVSPELPELPVAEKILSGKYSGMPVVDDMNRIIYKLILP